MRLNCRISISVAFLPQKMRPPSGPGFVYQVQEAGDGTHCAYEGMVSIGLDGTLFFWGATPTPLGAPGDARRAPACERPAPTTAADDSTVPQLQPCARGARQGLPHYAQQKACPQASSIQTRLSRPPARIGGPPGCCTHSSMC